MVNWGLSRNRPGAIAASQVKMWSDKTEIKWYKVGLGQVSKPISETGYRCGRNRWHSIKQYFERTLNDYNCLIFLLLIMFCCTRTHGPIWWVRNEILNVVCSLITHYRLRQTLLYNMGVCVYSSKILILYPIATSQKPTYPGSRELKGPPSKANFLPKQEKYTQNYRKRAKYQNWEIPYIAAWK